MRAMASQFTGVTIVCSTVGSGTDKRKHQSSISLVFVWGFHRWPVNSPHKRPVTWKMFPLMRSSYSHVKFHTWRAEHYKIVFWQWHQVINIIMGKHVFNLWFWLSAWWKWRNLKVRIGKYKQAMVFGWLNRNVTVRRQLFNVYSVKFWILHTIKSLIQDTF